jgi:hypothetical protein
LIMSVLVMVSVYLDQGIVTDRSLT